jgi:gamma-glutamylcyclotransferase (GGCT)/AIG2-like uncharacterized protein YtfP
MNDHSAGNESAPVVSTPMIRPARRAMFSYGANMSGAAMRARCATASLVCVGRVQGQFRINGYGVATIVLDRPATVHGVLWTVTSDDEAALDVFEGVEAGFYVKRTVDVLTQCGKRVRAFAYVSTEARPGSPRAGYLAEIIASAHEHSFPDAYIREIAEWSV